MNNYSSSYFNELSEIFSLFCSYTVHLFEKKDHSDEYKSFVVSDFRSICEVYLDTQTIRKVSIPRKDKLLFFFLMNFDNDLEETLKINLDNGYEKNFFDLAPFKFNISKYKNENCESFSTTLIQIAEIFNKKIEDINKLKTYCEAAGYIKIEDYSTKQRRQSYRFKTHDIVVLYFLIKCKVSNQNPPGKDQNGNFSQEEIKNAAYAFNDARNLVSPSGFYKSYIYNFNKFTSLVDSIFTQEHSKEIEIKNIVENGTFDDLLLLLNEDRPHNFEKLKTLISLFK